ncbi:hypothetical protein [Paenibacillus foliorum]|nr:hypothetical protein [Paenibacillus foliorum]
MERAGISRESIVEVLVQHKQVDLSPVEAFEIYGKYQEMIDS